MNMEDKKERMKGLIEKIENDEALEFLYVFVINVAKNNNINLNKAESI